MALKPLRDLIGSNIDYSLMESSGNAGAAVKIVGNGKVGLASYQNVGSTAIAGLLLQDVRPWDYTSRPQRLCDSTAVSGEKVGIITVGSVITDQCSECAGAFTAGDGVQPSGLGQLIKCTAVASTAVSGVTITRLDPYMIGKVLATSGELGMYGYIKVQIG